MVPTERSGQRSSIAAIDGPAGRADLAAEDVLLDVDGLNAQFELGSRTVGAVEDVSFTLRRGESLGLVGESGSGKSVTALSLMGLLSGSSARVTGRAELAGEDLISAGEARLRELRGSELAMIFQDPMTTLNPTMTVGRQIYEVVQLHERIGRRKAQQRALEMLNLVGIPDPEQRMRSYPHELSGGMRQRIMIAIALSCNPSLLIADEPTTALDVTIQAQVLAVMSNAVRRRGTALLLITHDLGVVAGMCTRVCVMYAGHIVEQGETREIFAAPRHPYTVGLLHSMPRLGRGRRTHLDGIPGLPPDVVAGVPPGCPFAPRCANATERCRSDRPTLNAFDGNPTHRIACWNPVQDASSWRSSDGEHV